ncbi:hypothetical protein ACLMJK_005422 [Lecanora helva]
MSCRTTQRVTGRSRTGLQISVPGRDDLGHTSVINSGSRSGRSIVYPYISSSSSGGRTTQSHGAVGDHLPSARSGLLSNGKLPIAHNDHPATLNKRSSVAAHEGQSLLANLTAESVPDQEPYKLIVVGETGPYRQRTAPFVISQSEFPYVPRRRRSLSDLIENPKGSNASPWNQQIPKAVAFRNDPAAGGYTRDTAANLEGSSVTIPIFLHGDIGTKPPIAPLWQRRGPPFTSVYRGMTGRAIHDMPPKDDLDPPTFQLPFGSKIFIMKTNDVHILRASVATDVWSSSKGANRVLQSAWEGKKGNERIILIFSMKHGLSHGGKYCGMAEMSGPYQADADPHVFVKELEGKQGIIPIHWILAKDIDFSVFADLKYKGKQVTQLRHANTVPGGAGRCLIQMYFEHEHSGSAIIHPKIDAPPAAPFQLSPMSHHRSGLHSSVYPSNQNFGPNSSHNRALQQRRQPTPQQMLRPMSQGYPPAFHPGSGRLIHPPSMPHFGYLPRSSAAHTEFAGRAGTSGYARILKLTLQETSTNLASTVRMA